MGWEYLVAAIVLLILSFVVMAVIAKRPVDAKPASITDFQFPQATEGTPQAVVFGDVNIPDCMMLWYGDLRSTPIKAKGGAKKG